MLGNIAEGHLSQRHVGGGLSEKVPLEGSGLGLNSRTPGQKRLASRVSAPAGHAGGRRG